jgi:hypothetical protein
MHVFLVVCHIIKGEIGYQVTLSHLDVFLLSPRLCCIVFKHDSFVKALFSPFSCRESTVNSSPKGVEEISIFTDFPQSDSIEIFTSSSKTHADQPEYKNLDYVLI